MATEIRAQITGTVWKIEKQVNDADAQCDLVVILEAVNLQIRFAADAAGTIAEIKVKEGDPVTEGAVIATLR